MFSGLKTKLNYAVFPGSQSVAAGEFQATTSFTRCSHLVELLLRLPAVHVSFDPSPSSQLELHTKTTISCFFAPIP